MAQDDKNYAVSIKYQDELSRIKKNVENARKFWDDNYLSYWKWSKFIYETTLDENWQSYLESTKKPKIEFNIIEPFINRQCGEFDKSEPSVTLKAIKHSQDSADIEELLEGFFRSEFIEARKRGVQRQVFADMLGKGFQVVKVWTDYKNTNSFEQQILWDVVCDPTFCFHDPMANKRHKGDGMYCGELFPYREEEFKELFPKVDISNIKYRNTLGKFSWSIKDNDIKIILVCDYYEKKKKRVKKVLLSTGEVMRMDDYKERVEQINSIGLLEQPPVIVDERYVMEETICLYRVIEDQVIEYKETNYSMLPYVWFIGSSVKSKQTDGSQIKEICRPLVYNAEGSQKMKNFAGICLLHAMENLPQEKWLVPYEGIPTQYQELYTDANVPTNVVYHAYLPTDPTKPLPQPQLVPARAINPELANAFMMADKAIQMNLGTYDSALGIQSGQDNLSGTAIENGAMNSNAAVQPYISNYMESLNQVANIMLSLIPKVWVEARTIQIIGRDGKTIHKRINDKNSIDSLKIDFDINDMNIKVEAGASFEIQKERSLKVLAGMAQAFPSFALMAQQNPEFLRILVENIDIKGADRLIELVDEFTRQVKEQQEKAKNMPPPPNIEMIKAQVQMQEVQRKSADDKVDAQLKAAQIAVMDKQADNDRMRALAAVHESVKSSELRAMETQAENSRTAADLAMKVADLEHKHSIDKVNVAHKSADIQHRVIGTLLEHHRHKEKMSGEEQINNNEEVENNA